jgi:ATP-dependent protease ClpP protease subunit
MNNKTKIQDAIDAKLIEERKVFLWGMVDDKSAKLVIDRLMYLDALEANGPIDTGSMNTYTCTYTLFKRGKR